MKATEPRTSAHNPTSAAAGALARALCRGLGSAVVLGAALFCTLPLASAQESAPAADATPAKPLAAPEPEGLRIGVEGLLRAMERAVLAKDAGAYMTLVDTADAEFVQEQRYFSNDFVRAGPDEFALSVGPLTASDGSATGELTMVWRMPEKNQRTVAWDARFIEHDGSWRYAGETWERFEAPGVIVMHDPGLDELAKLTAEAFAVVRGHVEELFELTETPQPKHTQKIKIYGNMAHLQASICLAYEQSLGGWNEPGESIKLLASRRTSPKQLQSLLAHEYGHCCTFVLGEKANNMPWWTLEGVAELAAEKYGRGGPPHAQVQQWHTRKQLADWADITDFHTTKPSMGGFVYSQGHHMVWYIKETHTAAKLNQWLRAMSRGLTIDEATKEVLGMDFATLDANWRAEVARRTAAAAAGEADEEKPKAEAPKSAEPTKQESPK
jgi:hypothetical protein